MLNFQKDRSFVVGKVYVCPYSATLKLVQFLWCSWNTAAQSSENMCSSILVLASAGKKLKHLEKWKFLYSVCCGFFLLFSEDAGWVGGPLMWPRTHLHTCFSKNVPQISNVSPYGLDVNYTHTCAARLRLDQSGWMLPDLNGAYVSLLWHCCLTCDCCSQTADTLANFHICLWVRRIVWSQVGCSVLIYNMSWCHEVAHTSYVDWRQFKQLFWLCHQRCLCLHLVAFISAWGKLKSGHENIKWLI